ncbi:MAG: HAMP domain-containing protein, partial [Melioribacteraceae bacterium]
MLKKMMLKHKLIAGFVAVGLMPILLIAVVVINMASSSIEQLAFNQLESVQIIKKSQIISYFNQRMGDAKMFSQMPFIENAIEELNLLNKQAADNNFKGRNVLRYEPYKRVYDKYLKFIKSYMETYGYYDIFLFAPGTGRVLLTVVLESDFATDMKDESHSLARAWQEANRNNKSVMTAMEPYAPSFGAPAMFMVVPIIKGGKNIGAIGMQIPNDQINGIMLERSGMGRTGETYLVGKDKLMRSDSYLTPNTHSVKESFKGNVENNGVNTIASNKALAGEDGREIITDYTGNQVLSVYGPVSFFGITWALIAEIDRDEALTSSISMTNFSIIVGIIILMLVIAIGIFISRNIKPLFMLADKLEVLTSKEGNLSEKLPESGNNEIGILAKLFNKFIESLHFM